MVRTIHLKVPKPRNCLGFIDLQTAAEVITIFTLINKVSGFYGILSVFTGAQISALQMSMYIWSILGTGVCLWALKQIRDEQTMKIVTYAYFFVLDFLINILYTILFASIWFLILSNSENTPALGGKTLDRMKSVAGFVDPLQTDVTKAHVTSTPQPHHPNGQHASLMGEAGGSGTPGSAGSTFSSMSIIFFWLLKIYFIIIVFSYARSLVVRSHLSTASFSLNSSIWARAQRWMLSGNYWREDDDDYKQSSRRGVN